MEICGKMARNYRNASSEFRKSVFFCSDGTLNPNGVRFGSSEIYNIGESLSADGVGCGCKIIKENDSESWFFLCSWKNKILPSHCPLFKVYSLAIFRTYSRCLVWTLFVFSVLLIFALIFFSPLTSFSLCV